MSSLINFKPENHSELKTPKSIVQEQCDELIKITDGLVIGKIQEYDGPIKNYTHNYASTLAKAITQNFDVQTELGDISEANFKYEFFISSKHTPKFKYRVLFLEYGLSNYPTTIVMDETIAKQLECNYNIECNDELEFVNTLEEILNSDKIKNVVNNLYSLNIQEESRF